MFILIYNIQVQNRIEFLIAFYSFFLSHSKSNVQTSVKKGINKKYRYTQ